MQLKITSNNRVLELGLWLSLPKKNRISPYLATGQLHPIVRETSSNISWALKFLTNVVYSEK